jgi:anti-sigma regulatory factor (Ser/Thr protein kinase)
MPAVATDFSIADDLLLEATHGRLGSHAVVALKGVGRIGPFVEIAMASIFHPQQYRRISFEASFARSLSSALERRAPFGSGYMDMAGAFPLGLINPVTAEAPDWDLWTKHAENVALSCGLNRNLVAGLLGALVELQDNIYEHSGAPDSGVVAYAVTPASFEFVVADRGMGVLKSLRSNPQFAAVTDSGRAIELAIADGVSRFPAETGRGQGFNQLFRALVGHNAEVRFRSGDHALTLRPGKSASSAASTLAQVAPLRGFSISVFCSNGTSAAA